MYPLMCLQDVRTQQFTAKVSLKSILSLGFHVLETLTVHVGDLTRFPQLHKLLTVRVRWRPDML